MASRKQTTSDRRTANAEKPDLHLEDRRKYSRVSHPIELDCKVNGIEGARIVGLSIGGGGLRVITSVPLPTDRTMPLEFALESSSAPFILRGKVIWQEKLDEFRSYISGIKFTRVSKEIREKIVSFVSGVKGMASREA